MKRTSPGLWLTLATSLTLAGCNMSQQASRNADGGNEATRHVANKPIVETTDPEEQAKGSEMDAEANSAAQQAQSPAPVGEMVTIKADHPAQIEVGRPYEYTLHVTNTSQDTALTQVKVKQSLSDGFSIESSEPKPDGDSEKEATWTIATLEPGETQQIKVKATSDQEGDLNQCLAVTYTPSVCLTAKVVKPEIDLSKEMPETASLCEQVTAIYRVHNSGSGPAKDLLIVDELPEGLTLAGGEKKVEIPVDEVAAGQTREFKANLVAQKTGELGSRAIAKLGEEKEIRSSHVATTFGQAELDVTLDGPGAEYLRRPMTYTATVKNTGNAAALGAQLNIESPEGVRVVRKGEAKLSKPQQQEPPTAGKPTLATPISSTTSLLQASAQQPEQAAPHRQQNAPPAADEPAAGDTDPEKRAADEKAAEAAVQEGNATAGAQALSWDLGDLAPGQEATVRFTVVAREKHDELQFKAVATHDCPSANQEQLVSTATTESRIIALPALLLAAVDDEDPIKVGNEVTYLITVRNQGDAPDQNVSVSATLPEGLEFVSASGDTKATQEGQKITFEKLDELGPGERANWQVRAKANTEGPIQFEAHLTSDGVPNETTTEEPTRLFKAVD